MAHAFPSEYMSAPTLAADLHIDVRTFRARVAQGDILAPSRLNPVNGRQEWRRSDVVTWLQSLARIYDAQSQVYDALTEIAQDRGRSDHDRLAAVRNLNALVRGELDVPGLLADVKEKSTS